MKDHDCFRPGPELDRTLSDHVDGLLDEAGEKHLADRLRSDAVLRNYYLRYFSLHSALQWDYAEAALDHAPVQSPPKQQTRFSPLAIGLAVAAVIAVGFFALIAGAPDKLVTVDLADGAVYRGAGTSHSVEAGMRLPAGLLAVESATGFAQLRFDDGTSVTLTGGSELNFTLENSQKSLRLREGDLSAKVAPQPQGKPMRILTPTAEIEVLGTILSVSSQASETGLTVNEGLVKLRRLVDGEQIEVPALHQATASLDKEKRLIVEKSSVPKESWRLRSGDPEIRVTKGVLDLVVARAIYRSEPYVATRLPDDMPVMRDGVAINGKLARLTESSRIELRYRSESTPSIFLSLSDLSGGFGGNLEVRVPDETLPADAEGWRTAQIPLGEFRVLARSSGRDTVYHSSILKKILISVSGDGEVEVAEVSVSP